MNKIKKQFIKNIIYAFSSQAISLLLSISMSLVVPKMLGVEEYGYWQLFLFYSGYVGFFHFGFNDGLYLRLGGAKYNMLDFSLLGTQIKISCLFQFIISMTIVFISLITINDSPRLFVLIATAIFLLLNNATLCLGYIFQAVNLTKIFSISIIIDKLCFLCMIAICLLFKLMHFEFYIIFYLASKALSLLVCVIIGRKLVLAHLCNLRVALNEMVVNIKVGISLMLASIASMLILGCGRFVIDNVWGIESFGKFSFANSIIQFVLMFISQVSMVLFPALRQSTDHQVKKVYIILREGLGVFLPMIFLCYIPLRYILGFWLPQYQESLIYLALLLPLCTFDGKMNILCNTYFKVFRKEKILLKVNIITVIFSLIFSLIGGYLIKNIYVIIVIMVCSIAFRSIISELYLSKMMGETIIRQIIQEVILVVIFMTTSWYLSSIFSFMIYFIAYIMYIFINKAKLKNIVSNFKRITH